MVLVSLVGGAKKSFNSDKISIEKENISINSLLEHLFSVKPSNTPDLDIKNCLIAINGADISALGGRNTIVKRNDVVSIIPVIHGGQDNPLRLQINKYHVNVYEVDGSHLKDHSYLDDIRTKFPKILFQAISSECILSTSHIQKILAISLTAYQNNSLLARNLEMDILLRFASTTQVSDAIKKTGIKKKTSFFLIAIGSKKPLLFFHPHIQEFLTSNPFSTDTSLIIMKNYRIAKKNIDAIKSKNKLEDYLVESAAILF